MNDSAGELHHKMCKKVAQLTKVIFYLNTKNDEYESNLKAVVNAYESELDNTVKEANAIIFKYKDSADSASKTADLETQLKKIQDSVDKEKEKSYQQFQKYRKAVEEKEVKQQTETSRKLRDYENEIETMRGRVQALGRTFDTVSGKLETERKQHEKTMSEYVKEQNDKYNALMKKKVELEEELHARKGKILQLQKLAGDLKKQLQDEIRKQKLSSESLLEELKRQSDKKISDLEQRLRRTEKMLEAKSADCEQLRSMNKLKDSEIEELKNRISKLEGHCQEKDRTIANIQGELTTKSGECNELKNKNLAQDKIIDQNKKAIQSLEQALALLTRESSLKNGEFDSMRGLYERQLAEKGTEIAMLKEKLQQLQKKMQLLGLELSGMKDANDKNNSDKLRQIERLKQTIEELNARIDSLRNNSSDQMKELQRLLKDKTAKFQAEMKEMILKYEQEIKQLHLRQLAEIQNIKKGHGSQLETLRASFEEEKRGLVHKYEDKIKELEGKLVQQIRKMEDSNGYLKKMYEEKILNYEKTQKELKESIDKATKVLETAKETIVRNQEQIQLLRKQKITLKQQISKLEKELEGLRDDRSKLQGNMGEEIQRLRQRLTELQFSYQQRIRLLKKDHENQLKLQERLQLQRFQEEKLRMKDEFAAQEELHKIKILDLQQQIKALSGRSELSNAEWLEKLRKKEEEFQLHMQLSNKKHIEELKQAEERYEKKIADLRKSAQEELLKAQESMAAQKKKELLALQAQKESEKKLIVGDYEDKLNKLSKKFDLDLEALKSDFEKKQKEGNDKLENQKLAHRATNEKYTELQSSFEILGNQVSQERISHGKTKEKLQDRQSYIRSLSDKLQAQTKGHNEEIARLKTEYSYRQLQQEQKRLNQKKCKTIIAEQIDWTQEIQKEFGNMLQENKNRLRLMEEEYQELKSLFDDRPSREQDLRMIQKLQQVLEQRQEDLKKAWQEMKFYKLELLNRENSYNKMFNANPNVGILDALQAKTKLPMKQREGLGSLPPVASTNTKKSIK